MCDAQQYDVQDVAGSMIPSIIRVGRSGTRPYCAKKIILKRSTKHWTNISRTTQEGEKIASDNTYHTLLLALLLLQIRTRREPNERTSSNLYWFPCLWVASSPSGHNLLLEGSEVANADCDKN